MTSGKNPIRIPFTEEENKTIIQLAEKAHLKRATLITAYLIDTFLKFEEKNKREINLSFFFKTIEITEPTYIQIYIQIELYERIKNISNITNISIPQFCRYLLLTEVNKEGAR